MKRELTLLTLLNLGFLMLLSLSGLTEGVISSILYYSAFLVPGALGIIYIKTQKIPQSEDFKIGIKLTRGGIYNLLPLIAPSVLLIFLISVLTSLIMTSLGATDSVEIADNLWLSLLLHAVLPAVLEEILFRYIPLKLMLPYSPKWAVILSALFFSLIHVNLFQIPYAFAAGIIFALINIMTGSIIPSIVLHFSNNAISVVYLMYAIPDGILLFYILLVSIAAASAAIIAVRHRRYRRLFAPLASKKSASFSLSPIAFAALTLFIAILNALA